MKQNTFRINGSGRMNLGLSNLIEGGFSRAFVIALISLLFYSASLVADEDPGFTEDAKKAIAQAVDQDKDIIFLFTGSDWCPPCKKLEAEVLSKEDFLFEVSKHYVLVKFDFPKMSAQSEEIAEQNKEYGEKFGIGGYPTLVLTDKHLKPFAFAGYEAGDFKNYLGLLEEARKLRVERDENLEKAKGKTGAERAKLLDQAISKICLLYTSPSPRDATLSRMPSSA